MWPTSFSPHIWLTVEPEAGLEAGPITETTPLGRIWHTERKKKNKNWKLKWTTIHCFVLNAALTVKKKKRNNRVCSEKCENVKPHFNLLFHCSSTTCLIRICLCKQNTTNRIFVLFSYYSLFFWSTALMWKKAVYTLVGYINYSWNYMTSRIPNKTVKHSLKPQWMLPIYPFTWVFMEGFLSA